MSDFNYQPQSSQSSVNKKPDVLKSRFGEGYEQRLANGINNKLRTWSLTFLRASVDIIAIELFLDEKGGVNSFTWTPLDFSETTIICREWDYNYLNGDARSLSCVFEEIIE
jgi:phage-related protein